MNKLKTYIVFVISLAFLLNPAFSVESKAENAKDLPTVITYDTTTETLSVKPYKATLNGALTELQIYRYMYLSVAIVMMLCLSYAAKARR